MTPLFQCRLLNSPFGDPALYVRLAGERRALLFDAGDISRTHPGTLVKVSDVFVSHTHIDHFVGFDHLLRLNLARTRTLRVYGPPGIIDNVAGKLRGYTWNLVSDYPFVVEVIEIDGTVLRRCAFHCREGFRPEGVQHDACSGALLQEPHFSVSVQRLDHRIDSLAYCLQERFHINIDPVRLQALGLEPGPWLRELKDAIWQGRSDDTELTVAPSPGCTAQPRQVRLGTVREQIATITRGQKIVYVTDCAGSAANMERICSFARGADVLYCEAAFLDRDADRARERDHLTAAQAGRIAGTSGAGVLRVFHFSPRYEGCAQELFDEAAAAFKDSAAEAGNDPADCATGA